MWLMLCRSFLGFTCLMQISTRSDDYVIDALALRNHLGPALAGTFADPQVLKVLHGADRDIEWLQKDFGLFVVNMLDTGRAARILGLPCGLGKLLALLCHVSVWHLCSCGASLCCGPALRHLQQLHVLLLFSDCGSLDSSSPV